MNRSSSRYHYQAQEESAFFRCLCRWITVAGLLSLVVAPNFGVQADAADDFSFHRERKEISQAWNTMTEARIHEILADSLHDLSQADLSKLSHHVLELCHRYSFDPAFILSMIQVESGFRPGVESSAGAVGLMQLMPSTAELVARKLGVPFINGDSLKNPFVNLSLGVAYLAMLREKYRGFGPYFHVAAYNLGPSRLDVLLSQKTFKPVKTKEYYERIRNGVHKMHNYKAAEKAA